MDGLKRIQPAQRARRNLESIRFYENKGLLPIAPRTASGYRNFSEDPVERLTFVKRAKALGFSLEEIRELLHLQTEQAEVRDLVQTKLSLVREKRSGMEKLEAQRNAALRKCNPALKQQLKPAEDCPVLRQIAEFRPEHSETKTNDARRIDFRGR